MCKSRHALRELVYVHALLIMATYIVKMWILTNNSLNNVIAFICNISLKGEFVIYKQSLRNYVTDKLYIDILVSVIVMLL